MLIHLGNNDFVDLSCCEGIYNLETIDEPSQIRIRRALPPEIRQLARAAVLTTKGRWLGSTLSPEALAHRGLAHPFSHAVFVHPKFSSGRARGCRAEE
jgi:hypothetical protein